MKKGWRIAFLILLAVCFCWDLFTLIRCVVYFFAYLDTYLNTSELESLVTQYLINIIHWLLRTSVTSIMLIFEILQHSNPSNKIAEFIAKIQLAKEDAQSKKAEREAEEREKKRQRIQEQIQALQEQLNNEETE